MPRYRGPRAFHATGPPRGEYTVETKGRFKYIKLSKTGRVFSYHEAQKQVDKGFNMVTRWLLRIVQIVPESTDYDLDEYYWERIDDYADRLEILAERIREEVRKHLKVRSKQERIKALRNVTGRTPEEAAIFLAKADELEKGAE